jgi:hypothetical protein
MEEFKRLSVEEASQFYSQKEDKLNSPIIGYTMVPDPNDPKWDLVTYYTSRRKTSLYKGEGKYYIYILENDTMPGLYKIGYTKNTPEQRASQISRSTGVPSPFKVAFATKCHNGEEMEYEVHKELANYRINNQREFFSCTLEEAKQAINTVSKRYA